MHTLIHYIFATLLNMGVLGLTILAIADSSFLFLPVGNDLLLVALVSRHHGEIALYVFAAALGSAVGVLLLDLLTRKGGEEGLRKMISQRQWNYLKKKMKDNSALLLIAACLAPPPFPFTAVVAAASAFQYPRMRLLVVVFTARVVRFTLVGLAAIWLHRDILRIANSKEFAWFMEGFIALCLVGSVLSVIRWIHLSRSGKARA